MCQRIRAAAKSVRRTPITCAISVKCGYMRKKAPSVLKITTLMSNNSQMSTSNRYCLPLSSRIKNVNVLVVVFLYFWLNKSLETLFILFFLNFKKIDYVCRRNYKPGRDTLDN